MSIPQVQVPARYELFGGAITADFGVPLLDASDVRQVPDSQEVLLSHESNDSFIVEVLDRAPPDDLTQAAIFHFDSLAHDNSATSSKVNAVTVLPAPPAVGSAAGPPQPTPVVLEGEQMVPKYNSTVPDRVVILLALFRVESKDRDVVLTANLPVQDSTDSPQQHNLYVAAFNRAVASFTIQDFGLFA